MLKACQGCGDVMSLRPSKAEQMFCGLSCASRSRMNRRQCSLCGAQCRKTDRRNVGAYCSSACYQRSRTIVASEAKALRRIAVNWSWRPSGKVVEEVAALRRIARWTPGDTATVRPCSDCGRKTVGSGERSRTCARCAAIARRTYRNSESGRRARRVCKARRRAVERGAQADRIDPIRVFERDGWRCHLCGCETPRHLRGTCEPRAPELDHIVPLASGGQHTWGNVACACRRCNGAKGAKAVGQLDLGLAA